VELEPSSRLWGALAHEADSCRQRVRVVPRQVCPCGGRYYSTRSLSALSLDSQAAGRLEGMSIGRAGADATTVPRIASLSQPRAMVVEQKAIWLQRSCIAILTQRLFFLLDNLDRGERGVCSVVIHVRVILFHHQKTGAGHPRDVEQCHLAQGRGYERVAQRV